MVLLSTYCNVTVCLSGCSLHEFMNFMLSPITLNRDTIPMSDLEKPFSVIVSSNSVYGMFFLNYLELVLLVALYPLWCLIR